MFKKKNKPKYYSLSFICDNCNHDFDANFIFGEDVIEDDVGCHSKSIRVICLNCGSESVKKRTVKVYY